MIKEIIRELIEEFKREKGEKYFGVIGIKTKDRSSVWTITPSSIPNPEYIDTCNLELEIMQKALHPNRLKILLICMKWRGKGQKEIEEITGLKGGALYHHLKELQLWKLLEKKDGKYRTTHYGTYLLAVALAGMGILKDIIEISS